MYIERVPNRNSPPCILLRESTREGKKIRKRTLANLTKLPPQVIEAIRLLLKAGKTQELNEILTGLKVLIEKGEGAQATKRRDKRRES